jgi:hypothetical protein
VPKRQSVDIAKEDKVAQEAKWPKRQNGPRGKVPKRQSVDVAKEGIAVFRDSPCRLHVKYDSAQDGAKSKLAYEGQHIKYMSNRPMQAGISVL